jgi:hypothetical protein
VNDAELQKMRSFVRRVERLHKLDEFAASLDPDAEPLGPRWPYVKGEPAVHREWRFWQTIVARFELYMDSGLRSTNELRAAHQEAVNNAHAAYQKVRVEKRTHPQRFFGRRKAQPEG